MQRVFLARQCKVDGTSPPRVVIDNDQTVPVEELTCLVQKRCGHARLETVHEAVHGIYTKVEDIVEDVYDRIRLDLEEYGLPNDESWNVGA